MSEVISWTKTILLAVCFAFIINYFVIVNASVPTGSMKNTISEKSRIVAFRLSYMLKNPKRYDIVVFKYPDDEKTLYVKRIIGMPGETLEIIDNKVYINGGTEPLNDSFILEAHIEDFGPIKIPEGAYFMLGDNRGNSQDSRFWRNKFVYKDKILGHVVFSYYPELKVIN